MTNTSIREMAVPTQFYHVAMRSRSRIVPTISEDCNGVQIKFFDTDNKNIRLVVRGAKKDVDKAMELLEAEVKKVEGATFTASLKVDPKYQKFIVGKRGATVSKIQDATNTIILLPNEGFEGKIFFSLFY